MRTSRSRDGSKRFVTGRPSRALARWWIRRSGSPGAYGRTPANRAGSSVSPARTRSMPPQRSGRSSAGVGDGPRPDEERVVAGRVLASPPGGRTRSPTRELDRPELEDAAPLRPDVEVAGRPARTARASRRSAATPLPVLALDERPLADDDAVASPRRRPAARRAAGACGSRPRSSVGISSPQVVRSRARCRR